MLSKPSQFFDETQTVTRLHRRAERLHAISWMLAGAVYLTPAHSLMAQPMFRVTDADDDVTFTDMPPVSGASTIEGQSVHAPNSAKPSQTRREPVEVEEPTRQDTRIVARANNPTIPMEAGNLVVQAAWTPRLASGETLQLLLDGEPVGAPQRIANWQLTNVYRGEHRLQVVRLDESGRQLDTSAASTVYVMRPTVKR